jgi:hypothetical protein
MGMTVGGAARVLPSVTAVFDAANEIGGKLVRVTGDFVQEAGQRALLADPGNVISSAGSSVVDATYAVELHGAAVQRLFDSLEPEVGSKLLGLDTRRAYAQIEGTARVEPSGLLGYPLHSVSIDVTDAQVVPRPTGPSDDGGFLMGPFG